MSTTQTVRSAMCQLLRLGAITHTPHRVADAHRALRPIAMIRGYQPDQRWPKAGEFEALGQAL